MVLLVAVAGEHAEFEIVMAPVKGRKRCLEKARLQIKGDYSRITDYARSSV